MPKATTVYKNGKSFAWSYSKLKNYNSCPKRHYHVDIAKDYKEEESEILRWGNMVHDGLASRLGPKKIPLPDNMTSFEEWAQRIESIPGELHTELKLAMREDFTGCGFFDRGVWLRGVCDVLVASGPVAYAGDWKLGKIIEDSVQLGLMAACVFANYPAIQAIRTEFIWLKDDATTRADFKRDDMAGLWNQVLPQVAVLKSANETMTYPPKPSGLCRRYCSVTACPHYGE